MVISFLLMVLFASLIGYAEPICGLPFRVELKYKTLKEVGNRYRKTEVILSIPILTEKVENTKVKEHKKPRVILNFSLTNEKAITEIQALEPLKSSILLVQPIEDGFVYEEANVRKIMSESPKVEEILVVYPADVKKNYIAFPLPPISVGEKLIIEYKYKGRLGKPFLKPVITFRKTKGKVVLKIKYSFLFKYARADVNDENIKNVKNLIKQLKDLGVNAKIEIIGYADGKTKNIKKNETIARKRATEIAKRIFPEEVKNCLFSSITPIKITQ